MTSDDLTAALAGELRDARAAQGLSVAALAERSGVSRAMIAKVERGEAQPTAVLLGRLVAALGLTLSELLGRVEGGDQRLRRAADQPRWTDPASGLRRRALSPPGTPLELVEVELPPGAGVRYPADAATYVHQQVWVLDGALDVTEGSREHRLRAGDCLAFGGPTANAFRTAGPGPCRYLVAMTARRG
ncbi:XRE family transcriptional regulator [Patulibacter sp. SYSU D01012]|uniref:helix-turn-helix domain-containing protein n=1 Tax=Patulibacter sp. SYSU D01012 TaxID=2817381 RepID=UPI001B3050C4|nr:XRE family transcriptional regulator [Patulibacter sp. SYSU D01012]